MFSIFIILNSLKYQAKLIFIHYNINYYIFVRRNTMSFSHSPDFNPSDFLATLRESRRYSWPNIPPPSTNPPPSPPLPIHAPRPKTPVPTFSDDDKIVMDENDRQELLADIVFRANNMRIVRDVGSDGVAELEERLEQVHLNDLHHNAFLHEIRNFPSVWIDPSDRLLELLPRSELGIIQQGHTDLDHIRDPYLDDTYDNYHYAWDDCYDNYCANCHHYGYPCTNFVCYGQLPPQLDCCWDSGYDYGYWREYP